MKILYPTLNIFDMAEVRWQAGITKESNVAAFPLWSLQKQNGWFKRSKNNMNAIKKNFYCLLACSSIIRNLK